MKRNKLLESLSQELGSQVPMRRYSLADMLSESYKVLYKSNEGSNLRKLAESHLNDVKTNPRDISRLSRQLCIVKELVKLTESGELKDEDLVDKKCYDEVEPKKERVLQDVKESSARVYVDSSGHMGTKGDKWTESELKNYWEENKDSDPVLANYDNYSNWLKDTLSHMEAADEDLNEAKEEYVWGDWQIERGNPRKVKYYTAGKDILNKIIGVVYAPATDSFRYGAEVYNNETSETVIGYTEFDDEDTAIRWIEDKFAHQTASVSTNTDEKVVENNINETEEIKENVSSCTWGDWQIERGSSNRVKFYCSGMDLTNQTIGVVYEPESGGSKYGAEIYDNKSADTIEGINEFDSEEEAKTWVENWFSQENVDECNTTESEGRKLHSTKDLKETNEPDEDDLTDEELEELAKHLENIRKERKSNKIAESQIEESKEVNESYKGLENFKKQSVSKPFYKTFKKMHDSLKEGKALTRKESIDLYKASNSALTQLSIELEHNPEFLDTFKESVTLLSKDVNSLLESLSRGKAPSKATMKSLAKFSESLLNEAYYGSDASNEFWELHDKDYKGVEELVRKLGLEDKIFSEDEVSPSDEVYRKVINAYKKKKDMKESIGYYGSKIANEFFELREKDPRVEELVFELGLESEIFPEDESEPSDESYMKVINAYKREKGINEAEETPEDFVGDDEGDIQSEEADQFDQEYADARFEVHNELEDKHEDSEDPDVQDKLEQDKEEVVDLPGISDEQVAELTGAEESPEEPEAEEEIDNPEEEEVVDDVTDDELAELKKHLQEMRSAKKMNEATSVEELATQVRKALDDAGISYSVKGRSGDTLIVSRKDLDRASEIRTKLDPKYTITVASPL